MTMNHKHIPSNEYAGFEQGPIRPPSEAASLLVRVTRNCPWNRCTFCPVYKGARSLCARQSTSGWILIGFTDMWPPCDRPENRYDIWTVP